MSSCILVIFSEIVPMLHGPSISIPEKSKFFILFMEEINSWPFRKYLVLFAHLHILRSQL